MKPATKKLFDPAEYLDDPESIAAYMDEAIKIGDAAFIADAHDVIARARVRNQLTHEAASLD